MQKLIHFPNYKIIGRCPIICTLGVFDGVHLGHKKILEEVVGIDREINGRSVVITFETHPKKIINPQVSVSLLTTTTEKIKLIKGLKIDRVIIIDFTTAFSKITAEDFVKRFLVKKFKIGVVVVGENYFFGKGRGGGITLLRNLGNKYGFDVKVVSPVKLKGSIISSSRIRKTIIGGDMESANKMLGRNYEIEGIVIRGKSIGSSLGFPTANINPINEVIPGAGVYAVKVTINEKTYGGMCNIGVKDIEVHIFKFNENIYGRKIKIKFLKKIRDERKFSSLEDLVAQIKKDRITIKNLLSFTK